MNLQSELFTIVYIDLFALFHCSSYRMSIWFKNIYDCLRIDHDLVTMAKNALRIYYELPTMFWNWEFVAKTWTVQNFCPEFPIDQNSLRIYTKLVGTSRTDNDSTTNQENCQFLEIRGIRGRSVIEA